MEDIFCRMRLNDDSMHARCAEVIAAVGEFAGEYTIETCIVSLSIDDYSCVDPRIGIFGKRYYSNRAACSEQSTPATT